MKVAFIGLKDWQKNIIKDKLRDFEVKFFLDSDVNENIDELSEFEILGIFVKTKIDSNVLKKLKKLKLIATMSTGYDHIDIKTCKKRNIAVCNVPTYGQNTVAEFTFSLILAISRNLIDSNNRLKIHHSFDYAGLLGFDLAGKTLGVIGTGNIGRNVIKIANGFSMNVICYDYFPNEKYAQELGFRYVDLHELYENSDIITIHVPLTKNTRHLINKSAVNLMKKGVVIINTSRGGIIKSDAILTGLNNGKIAHFATDVLEDENDFIDSEHIFNAMEHEKCAKLILQNELLINHPRVIVTPHVAFYTKEAISRIINQTIMNILSFKEEKIINKIN